MRSVKKNPPARRKMIPDANKDLDKGMKSMGNMIWVTIKLFSY